MKDVAEESRPVRLAPFDLLGLGLLGENHHHRQLPEVVRLADRLLALGDRADAELPRRLEELRREHGLVPVLVDVADQLRV